MRGFRGRQPPDKVGGSVLPPTLGLGQRDKKGPLCLPGFIPGFMRKRFIDDTASEADAFEDDNDAVDEVAEEELTLTSLDEEAIREIVLEALAQWHTFTPEQKAVAASERTSRLVPDGSHDQKAVPAGGVSSATTVQPQAPVRAVPTLGIRPLRLAAAAKTAVLRQSFKAVPVSSSTVQPMETDASNGVASQPESALH